MTSLWTRISFVPEEEQIILYKVFLFKIKKKKRVRHLKRNRLKKQQQEIKEEEIEEGKKWTIHKESKW